MYGPMHYRMAMPIGGAENFAITYLWLGEFLSKCACVTMFMLWCRFLSRATSTTNTAIMPPITEGQKHKISIPYGG